MELGVPDRVPIYEMHVSTKIAAVVLNKSPSQVLAYNPPVLFDLIASGRKVDVDKVNRRIAEELVELATKLGLDWIRVGGAYTKIPEVKKLGENTWLVDGSVLKWSGESMWNLSEPKHYDSDEIVREFREREVEVDYKVLDILREVVEKTKGEFFISFDADGSWGPIVSRPSLLRHVLVWMRRRPDAVEAIIDYYTRLAIEYGKAAIDEGADAIQMCVDYGCGTRPWISPSMFRRFVKPALKKQCDVFKKKEAFAVLHSDGNIESLLPDIVDAGISAYQGIDVMAGMSLKKVKEMYGDKICLVGNVDPRVIEFGSKSDVAREVDRCLKEGARGGGFVLSTSANISICTNAENFLFMIKYAKRRGVYGPKGGIAGLK